MKDNPKYIGDVITAGEFYFSETFLKEHISEEKMQEFKKYANNFITEQREKFKKEYENRKYIHPIFGGDYFAI